MDYEALAIRLALCGEIEIVRCSTPLPRSTHSGRLALCLLLNGIARKRTIRYPWKAPLAPCIKISPLDLKQLFVWWQSLITANPKADIAQEHGPKVFPSPTSNNALATL